ncbi:hypothetical protein C8R47DRAFT_397055 [Mycena vitilis]|nr:hypothetical protein C8R47DRAFT_397055 [Mycena vitilis]
MSVSTSFASVLLLVTAVLAACRECAVCPPTIEVVSPEKQRYTLKSREVQPENVVCGYLEESYSRKRNGWPYCTYNDAGIKTDGNFKSCPAKVEKTTNCTETNK